MPPMPKLRHSRPCRGQRLRGLARGRRAAPTHPLAKAHLLLQLLPERLVGNANRRPVSRGFVWLARHRRRRQGCGTKYTFVGGGANVIRALGPRAREPRRAVIKGCWPTELRPRKRELTFAT